MPMGEMGQKVLDILEGLPIEVQVMILSALPITELRVTIPIAIGLGMEPVEAMFYAILGNFIPIIPLLLCLPSVINILNRYGYPRRIVRWTLFRTRAKGIRFQKYGALGLMLLVSVPLPLTGVWSASIVAFLFGIPFKIALLSITLGLIICGILVTLASIGFYTILRLLGTPVVVLLIGLLIIAYFIYKKRY